MPQKIHPKRSIIDRRPVPTSDRQKPIFMIDGCGFAALRSISVSSVAKCFSLYIISSLVPRSPVAKVILPNCSHSVRSRAFFPTVFLIRVQRNR
jgi:hypothetical protein